MRKYLLRALIGFGIAAIVIAGYLAVSASTLRVNIPAKATTADVVALLVRERYLPSVSYAVIRNGVVVQSATTGVADNETKSQADDSTLYEAASLTKPVVATIAMRLFDKGIFSLDESVAETIPLARAEDRERAKHISARHLLSHTSGLPNWCGDSLDPNRTDRLEFQFDPGEQFSYSGEGYGILLSFLEAKSGRAINDLANELFAELEMSKSTLVAAEFGGTYARGHWGMTPDRHARRTNSPIAAYSLFTTADDYAKFLVYVLAPDDISPQTLSEFWKVQVDISQRKVSENSTDSIGWSLGWGALARQSQAVYFQWGDNGAFRSFAAFTPDTGNGIVYLCNGSLGTLYANEISAPILGDISTATDWFSGPIRESARTILKF